MHVVIALFKFKLLGTLWWGLMDLDVYLSSQVYEDFNPHVTEGRERGPSQGAPSPTSALVSLARHKFKGQPDTHSGNEMASIYIYIFMKHMCTKL